MTAPQLAKLGYREALAKIESFERACAARDVSSSEAIAEARAILADIRSLDWARIPARWCRH